MKTILLVNDDGIESIGLFMLKEKLEELGEVVVVTPRNERSGIGKAITSSEYVQVVETRLKDGSTAYAISGTPADAVLLALNKILNHPPDLLVAGVNLGPNLGIDDCLNSGTLGAALEAAIHDVPAVAVSYCKREFIDQQADKAAITETNLDFTVKFTQKIAEYVLKNGMPRNAGILSINVPENADCQKLKVTDLSYVGYRDIWTHEKDGYRIASWKLADYEDSNPTTDIHAVKRGYISITPIKVQFSHNRNALESMIRAIRFE